MIGNTRIENKYGELLEGFLHEADTEDLIIVCHGFNSDMKEPIIKEICDELNKTGYNVFRFNFSGDQKDESSFIKQTSDLKSVIDYFVTQKYNTRHFNIKCVIGHSTGGTVAILGAAQEATQNDYKIKSIALLAARINLSKSTMARKIEEKYGKTPKELLLIKNGVTFSVEIEIKGKLYCFSKKYVEDLAWLNVIDRLKQIKVPILILHGDEDVTVEIDEGGIAANANKKAIFFPIVNADHSFTEYAEKASGVISDWLVNNHCIFELKRTWANFCFKFKHSLLCPKIKKLILFPLVIFAIYFTLHPAKFLFLQKYQPLIGDKFTESMIWWAILTVMSMLTLNYIGLINRLKERYEDGKEKAKKEWNFKIEKNLRDISWIGVLLAWSVFFMLITIGAVVFRIFYLYTDWYLLLWTCPQQFLSYVDGVMLYSFTISTALRMYAFLDSYWEELLKYPFWFNHYPKHRKGKILRFVFHLVDKLKKIIHILLCKSKS
jgi:alpha/beta superfamily hydrolase